MRFAVGVLEALQVDQSIFQSLELLSRPAWKRPDGLPVVSLVTVL